MDGAKIDEILKNNRIFYKKHAEEFSKTRQNPWPGWNKLIPIINDNFEGKSKLSTLDLGCGNARFYAFLTNFLEKEVDYLGLDNNDYFLVEALLKYPLAKFNSHDIFLDLQNVEEKYDLVVSFGITHHIPGNDFRLAWFTNLCKLVHRNGLLILTFWNLNADERFEKAETAKDLQENDFYYGWGDSTDKRYVHIYSENETKKISEIFKKNNLKLVSTFDSDGKNNLLNTYIVLRAT